MPNAEKTNKQKIGFFIGLGCAVALGLACRLCKLGVSGLTIDESISVAYSENLRLILQSVRPPVYYLLLAAWRWVFSDGPIALRLLSVLAGVASIILLALIAKRLASRRTGIIAAFLLACLPIHVYTSRLADVGALSIALGLAAIYCLVVMSEKDTDATLATVLAGLNIVGVFTCYYFLLALIAQALVLVFIKKSEMLVRRDIAIGLGAPVAALVLASPLLYTQFKTLVVQLSAFPSLTRIWEAPWSLWANDMTLGAPWFYAESAGEVISLCLTTLGVVFFVAGTAACISDRRTGGMAILAMFYGTAFAMLTASTIFPLWSPLGAVHFIPFYVLVIACGLTLLKKASLPVAVTLACVVSMGVIINAYNYPGEGAAWKKAPEWNRLAADLSTRYGPGDNIIVSPGWIAQALRYHLSFSAEPKFSKDRERLPIIGAPFDFYNPDADLQNRIQLPEAPRSWIVSWRGYADRSVDRLMIDTGHRFSHSTDYWQLRLSLYRLVSSDDDDDEKTKTKGESEL